MYIVTVIYFDLTSLFFCFSDDLLFPRFFSLPYGSNCSYIPPLQIPTSFRYRHGNEHEQRRGRNRSFRRDFTENQLSMAIEASLQTANTEQTFRDQSASGSGRVAVDDDNGDIDSLIQPFESLDAAGSEASSRYLQALGHSSRSGPLEDSSFPPLPITSNNGQQGSKH